MTQYKKKLWFVVVAALIITCGLLWYAYMVQYPKVKNIAEDIQKEKLDAIVKEEKSKRIMNIRDEVEGLDEQKKEIDSAFVTDSGVVGFLQSLEAIAGSTGNSIKISTFDLQKLVKQPANSDDADEPAKSATDDQTGKKASKVPPENFESNMGFTVELEGNYTSMLNFIKQMENIPYFIQIRTLDSLVSSKKINISTQAAQAGTGQQANQALHTTLVIITYTK
jgi:hypothetical protein